jgi:hypothetical protein
MVPWHLVKHSPEELEEIARRMQRMQDRLDMSTEIIATPAGFIARRDGNVGCGATREEAIRDLYDKENMDAVNPPPGAGLKLSNQTGNLSLQQLEFKPCRKRLDAIS